MDDLLLGDALFCEFFEIYDVLIIHHWVAPAIAINFGLSWSLPSLFLS